MLNLKCLSSRKTLPEGHSSRGRQALCSRKKWIFLFMSAGAKLIDSEDEIDLHCKPQMADVEAYYY